MQATVRLQCWLPYLRVLPLILLTACAGQRVDWDSRLGHASYDQTVMELGPPDKEASLSDGTRVAEWLTHRSRSGTYVGTVGGYPGRYHPYYGYFGPGYPYDAYAAPDREYWLRLTFGPDNRLADWRKIVR